MRREDVFTFCTMLAWRTDQVAVHGNHIHRVVNLVCHLKWMGDRGYFSSRLCNADGYLVISKTAWCPRPIIITVFWIIGIIGPQ